MNTFGQGFKLGFASGLFNNLFGGCSMFDGCSMPGFNGYMANPFCNYSFSPMFLTPMFSFGSFMPYNNISTFSNPFSFIGNLGGNSVWNTSSFNQNLTFEQYINASQPQYNIDSFVYTSNTPKLELGSSYETNASSSTPVTIINSEAKPDAEKPFVNKTVDKKKKEKDESSASKESLSANEMANKWSKKYPKAKNITKEFCQKVIDISKEIQCEPEDLMALMNLESAHSFDPAQQNLGGHEYYGLIQFGESAAADVGKTLDELKSMTAIEQLDYVKKYLIKQKNARKVTGKLDTKTLYCLVLYPKATNQSDDYIIAKKGSKTTGRRYDANSGLDVDGSNTITRGELDRALDDFRV